jgi:hypothetical protein
MAGKAGLGGSTSQVLIPDILIYGYSKTVNVQPLILPYPPSLHLKFIAP